MNALGATLHGNPYSFEYDRAHRMGKPQQNRTRPVALILMRHRDKQNLFAALAKCKEKGELKEVYINSARTEAENEKYIKLLTFAKATKEKDSTAKYRIRNLTLQITGKDTTGFFHINNTGQIATVAPPKHKDGDRTSTKN